MKAIILAAGRGSRMGNLTDELPKCLLDLKGEKLLDRQIKALREAGIDEIGIVTGYKRELLQSRGLREFYNPRWDETNMVSSLEFADVWLASEPCIVSYSDIYFESKAVRLLMNCSDDLAITYDVNWKEKWSKRFQDPLSDAETFRIDGGFVTEIGGTPRSVDDVQGQYMGLLKFSPESWQWLKNFRSRLDSKLRDKMHMTGTLQALIGKGEKVRGLSYDGNWGEYDSPGDLKYV